MQQHWGQQSEKRKEEERRSEKRKAEKMFCGFGGSKSRLAKAAGAEPSGEIRSQKVKNTSHPELFCQLRCWKSAGCCGAKHIRKPKVFKTDLLGPLLGVEMLKTCTQLQLQLQLHYTTPDYNYTTPH